MAYAQQQLDAAPVMVDTQGIAVYENIVELHAFNAAFLWLLRLQVIAGSIVYDNQLQRSAAVLKLAVLELNSTLSSSATPTVIV